jgi:hypothetical protein
VLKVFAENNERVKHVLGAMLAGMPAERLCGCGSALSGAR